MSADKDEKRKARAARLSVVELRQLIAEAVDFDFDDMTIGALEAGIEAIESLPALNAEIVRLRGEVERALAYLDPHLNAGTFAAPDWAIQMASILTGGDGCGTPLAPAEAKGDACNCPGGSKRDPEKHAPNCPVRTLPCRTLVNPFDTPQPAGGES